MAGRDEEDRWEESGGRQKKKGSAVGNFFITVVLVVAIGVFAYSGYKLLGYYMAYKAGSDEYSGLNDEFVQMDQGEPGSVTPSASGGAAGDSAGADGTASGADGTAAGTEGAAGTAESEEESSSGAHKTYKFSFLSSIEDLEKPEKREKLLEEAEKEETVESGVPVSLPRLKNPINFVNLHEVNPEVVGWIRIGAIDVSYPVAQAADNDFYLHRTFRKEDNFAGCIFLNCDNKKDFSDQNSIIYGHNMKNLSMFGRLKEFANQETYEKDHYFWVFTPKFIYQYEIFSCSLVNKAGNPYVVHFEIPDYEKFIEQCIAASEIKCGDVKITPKDRIMTLSTCTGDSETRRILQGVLKQVYISV